MFPKGDTSPVSLPGWVSYLLAMLLFIAMMVPNWIHHGTGPLGPFADAHVYARAAAAGADPYRTDPFYFPFVYPPFVVRCGVLLCPLIAHHLSFRIYILLTWIGLLACRGLSAAAISNRSG